MRLNSAVAEVPVKFQSDLKSQSRIYRLRDFARSCGKTPVRLVNRGPGCLTIDEKIGHQGNIPTGVRHGDML